MVTCGCTAISDGPGTLGAVAVHELNCSESDLGQELDRIIRAEQFKPDIIDTNIIDWWERGGYDFLNYKCLNIQKTLYMVTVNSGNSTTADISIRAFYSRKRKEWMFAREFTSAEKYNAEKAMEYLLNYISGCE